MSLQAFDFQLGNQSLEALIADPENRLLSRFNRRRVDVETLRDSMLFVSGDLPLEMGAPAAKWERTFSQTHRVRRSEPVPT